MSKVDIKKNSINVYYLNRIFFNNMYGKYLICIREASHNIFRLKENH